MFTLTIILLLLGVVAVYNASIVEAFQNFNDRFYFAKQQFIWASFGVVVMLIASRFPLEWLRRLAPLFFVFALILMVVVLIPGVTPKIMGARRWIVIGGINLQPSELMKPALIVYLASYLSKPRPVTAFLVLIGIVVGLTMLQPDLGTTIIITATGFLLYYFSGAPLKHILSIGSLGALTGSLLILLSPYRRARLLTFLDPTTDPLGSSYHINQVLLALGTGGLTGVGLGRSRQKYNYLPEATTDSIFAVIAEETGFIGAMVLVTLLLLLILMLYKIAFHAKPGFQQLLAAGIASWIACQAVLNIAAMIALVPLTGIPLPLISYGGSALITTLAAIGLSINIGRHQNK